MSSASAAYLAASVILVIANSTYCSRRELNSGRRITALLNAEVTADRTESGLDPSYRKLFTNPSKSSKSSGRSSA